MIHCQDCGTPLSRSAVYAGSTRCKPCAMRAHATTAAGRQQMQRAARAKHDRDRANTAVAERVREAAVFRYVEAHDTGDLETVADVLRQAMEDPALARQLAEVDTALHAEAAERASR